MNNKPTIPIDVIYFQRILDLDDSSPSGLRWKNNYSGFRGKPAGHLNELGYWTIRVKKKLYYAHRVVKALLTGKDPGNFEVRR